MLRGKASLIILSTLIFFFSFVAADTAPHAYIAESEHFQAKLFNPKEDSAINTLQQWILHLEDKQGNPLDQAQIRIRGGMPDHNHGLPTAPQVSEELGGGDYLVSGLKFHMAGRWQLEFIVTAHDQQDILLFELQL